MKLLYRVSAPFLALALFTALSVSGCGRPTVVIPREDLFAANDRSQVRLSPDGNYLTWIADYNGALNIYIRTVGQHDDRPVTEYTENGVNSHIWARNSVTILFSRRDSGKTLYYLHDITTGETKTLQDKIGEEIQQNLIVEVVQFSEENFDEVALMMNRRDPSVFDLYKMNVRTGKMGLIAEGNSRLLRWYVDTGLRLTGYLLSEDDGGQSFWRYDRSAKQFRHEITWTINDDSSWPVFFNSDGSECILLDSRGRDNVAIYNYNLKTKSKELIIADPGYDIRMMLYDRKDFRVLAAIINADRLRYVPVDESIAGALDYLKNELGESQYILARSEDNSRWLIEQIRDTSPAVYYLYSPADSKLERLFSSSDDLLGMPFAKMKAIEFTARDGYKIPGYLTTPVYGNGPWPTVLLVHEGPWRRDSWGFDPEVQWLANRGYACLQVNFRGSANYGKEFLNAGNREWGGKMLTDIEDAAKWAVSEKIADADRVGIMGGSFGGYAAIASLCFTDDVFDAAVAVNPFLNVGDYLASIPPTWEAYRTNLEQRVGIVPRYESGLRQGEVKDTSDWSEMEWEEIRRLESISPYFFPDKIDVPLLIAQGQRDPLANPKVAAAYVEKLKEDGKNIDYVTYKNSSHSLTVEDRLDFYQRAEVFLAAYLGGRIEH